MMRYETSANKTGQACFAFSKLFVTIQADFGFILQLSTLQLHYMR
jgi:hypothetical protein